MIITFSNDPSYCVRTRDWRMPRWANSRRRRNDAEDKGRPTKGKKWPKWPTKWPKWPRRPASTCKCSPARRPSFGSPEGTSNSRPKCRFRLPWWRKSNRRSRRLEWPFARRRPRDRSRWRSWALVLRTLRTLGQGLLGLLRFLRHPRRGFHVVDAFRGDFLEEIRSCLVAPEPLGEIRKNPVEPGRPEAIRNYLVGRELGEIRRCRWKEPGPGPYFRRRRIARGIDIWNLTGNHKLITFKLVDMINTYLQIWMVHWKWTSMESGNLKAWKWA